MKRMASFCLAIITILCLTACTTTPKRTLSQVGTIDALLAGHYDGSMTCQQLIRKGDFGIGTFDKLDGEMVVFEGNVYQVKADGKVYEPQPELTTPFASVCKFIVDRSLVINSPSDLTSIKSQIDKEYPSQNIPLAIKIRGTFKYVKTRSVPAQTKPYRILAEVTKKQPEFERENVAGTLVGVRLPELMGKLNVPGYHLHFLSDDKTFGGHLLSADLEKGVVDISVQENLFVVLPVQNEDFLKVNYKEDRSGQLYSVEQEQRK